MSRLLEFLDSSGMDLVNVLIMAAVLALFWLLPAVFSRIMAGLARTGEFVDRHAGAAILCAALAPLLVRALLLPTHPIPAPTNHDEFSYLVAADTFAHGRVTNPPHPLFQFFETMHVLPQPTYMSKYPPLQGLLLALGQVLFGHPWWGEFLSMGLLTAATGWMILAWLPGRWAALGALAIGVEFGIGHSWMNSYWGGAPAAIGACVFLGAFGRLREFRLPDRHPIANAALTALGIVLLANSRPWEGIAVIAASALISLPWLFAKRAQLLKLLPPAVAVLAVGASGMLYYNARITGSPLRMPYTTIHAMYSVAPLFVWQQRTPELPYRHPAMRRFYLETEPHYQDADQANTLRGWLSLQPSRIRMAKDLLFGNFFLLLSLPVLLWPGSAGMRLLRACLVLVIGAMELESWQQIHYFGPIIAVAALIKLAALMRVADWRWHGRPLGMALALGIALCAAVRTTEAGLEFPKLDEFAIERAKIQQHLETLPGQQVVFVRYRDDHPPSEEWVYNAADIDHSKVVWAREMNPEENRKLLAYYKGRTFWLLEPRPEGALLTALPAVETSARTALAPEKTP